MTANGVTSVSLHPPLALACVGRRRNTHDLIVGSEKFGISVLEESQQPVAEHFMRDASHREGEPPGRVTYLGGEWPVIDGAIAQMGCRLVEQHRAGDHTIFIAAVEQLSYRDGEPLLWFKSGFTRLHPHHARLAGH